MTHTVKSSDAFCLDRACLTSVISLDRTSPLTPVAAGDHAYVYKYMEIHLQSSYKGLSDSCCVRESHIEHMCLFVYG